MSPLSRAILLIGILCFYHQVTIAQEKRAYLAVGGSPSQGLASASAGYRVWSFLEAGLFVFGGGRADKETAYGVGFLPYAPTLAENKFVQQRSIYGGLIDVKWLPSSTIPVHVVARYGVSSAIIEDISSRRLSQQASSQSFATLEARPGPTGFLGLGYRAPLGDSLFLQVDAGAYAKLIKPKAHVKYQSFLYGSLAGDVLDYYSTTQGLISHRYPVKGWYRTKLDIAFSFGAQF